MKAEQAAALPPRSATRSGHAARRECSVSETPRAAADRDAATPRKTSRSPRRPGQEKVGLAEGASPGFSPPHAASRTFSTTKENVRSDAHYVGKTGLRLSPVRQGGALPCFARPAARCRPNKPRHCVGRTGLRLGWVREDRAPPRLRTAVAPSPAPKQKPPRSIARSGAVVHSVFIPSCAPR